MPFSDLVIRIDAAPKIERDGEGVRVTYKSGKTEFAHSSSRANMRKACECGIRMLDAWDREDTVVQFPVAGVG